MTRNEDTRAAAPRRGRRAAAAPEGAQAAKERAASERAAAEAAALESRRARRRAQAEGSTESTSEPAQASAATAVPAPEKTPAPAAALPLPRPAASSDAASTTGPSAPVATPAPVPAPVADASAQSSATRSTPSGFKASRTQRLAGEGGSKNSEAAVSTSMDKPAGQSAPVAQATETRSGWNPFRRTKGQSASAAQPVSAVLAGTADDADPKTPVAQDSTPKSASPQNTPVQDDREKLNSAWQDPKKPATASIKKIAVPEADKARDEKAKASAAAVDPTSAVPVVAPGTAALPVVGDSADPTIAEKLAAAGKNGRAADSSAGTPKDVAPSDTSNLGLVTPIDFEKTEEGKRGAMKAPATSSISVIKPVPAPAKADSASTSDSSTDSAQVREKAAADSAAPAKTTAETETEAPAAKPVSAAEVAEKSEPVTASVVDGDESLSELDGDLAVAPHRPVDASASNGLDPLEPFSAQSSRRKRYMAEGAVLLGGLASLAAAAIIYFNK